MVEAKNKWWLVDNQNTIKPTRSSWLQSTLSDLDEKTKAMLKIIEEDADSFAQRAEMYYKKRPELITMVEEFYRSHRSLAERYDQVKSDSGNRLLPAWAPSLSFNKERGDKLICSMERSYDSYSEIYEPEECGDSEVDDPEPEVDDSEPEPEADDPEADEEAKYKNEMKEASSEFGNSEVMKLHEEIAKLKEENKLQQEYLMQKDEEKREAIRQLSFTVDMLKEDNRKLRKMVAAKETPTKQSPLELRKLKEGFWGKLFNGSPQQQKSAVRSLELISSK